MAETALLLPPTNYAPYDHPIFIRVCHSPWPVLRQKLLLLVRCMLAVYLTVVLVLSVVNDCKHLDARFFAFDARNIGFAVQAIYYWITAVCLPPKHGATGPFSKLTLSAQTWTMQHLLGFPSPANRLPPEEQAKGKYLARMQKAFSIPSDTDVASKKRIAFSLFYTAAVTFPFVVTIASWSFLNPLSSSVGPPFWPTPVILFIIVNFNVVNSAIALLEVMTLSSVHKQKVKTLYKPRNIANLFSRWLYHSRSSPSAWLTLFG